MTSGLAKLRNFSVTQYRAFNVDIEGGCKRKWYFQTIARLRGPKTEALERGVHVHDLIKGLIQGDPEPDDPYLIFAKAVSKFFPEPGENVLVEHGLSLDTHLGLPWTGYVDLFRHELPTPVLIDWKTTSSIRKYGLSPADLHEDIQVNAYGHYGWVEGLSVPTIRAGLVYIELPTHQEVLDIASGKRKKPFTPKTMPVFVDLRRENALRVWENTRPVLDEMVKVAACESAQDVEPNTQSCPTFGGCPFRAECGLAVRAKNGIENALARWASKKQPDQSNENKEKLMSAFMDKVRASAAAKAAPANGAKATNGNGAPKAPAAAQAAAQAPAPVAVATSRFQKKAAPAAAQAPTAQVPTGVVPPDAPPRDTRDVVEAVEAAADAGGVDVTEAPKKRGRPRKTETEGASLASTQTSPGAPPTLSVVPPPTPTTATKKSFALWIDSLPVKGYEETITSLEDWWGPLSTQLDEWALAEKNLPSYWLAEFGEQKAMVSLLVRDQIAKHGLPKAMHVNSSSSIARDLLPLLIPHATLVVKQTRG